MLEVLECHDKVVEEGIRGMKLAAEVNGLFGASNVDHFISGFQEGQNDATWCSVAHFNGRYMFSLKVPITVDYSRCRFLSANTAGMFIQINQVTNVALNTSGIAEASLKGQWRMIGAKWKILMAHRGDWASVNIPILTNSPVAGFEEYVRQEREPILRRKRGFDDVFKATLEKVRTEKAIVEPGPTAREGAPLTLVECHDRMVQEGVKTLGFPEEVNAFFGTTNVDHFVSNFGSKTLPAMWNSVAYFLGRYRFSLHVPISIDYQGCRLIGATNGATILITDCDDNGGSKSSSTQWLLNQNQWEWLLKNNGDWSVLKLPLLTNAPLKGFSEYVSKAREPILQRQGDFAAPIKRSLSEALKEARRTRQE